MLGEDFVAGRLHSKDTDIAVGAYRARNERKPDDRAARKFVPLDRRLAVMPRGRRSTPDCKI
jgi:hypothetical protein